jgi:alkylation response protein AidB-like acyl-CoA dehydrogenase
VVALAWQGGYGALDPDWSQVRLTSTGAGLRLHGWRMLVEAGATHWLVPASADGGACVVLIQAPRAGLQRQRASDGSVLVAAELDEAVPCDAVLLQGEAATAAVQAALAQGRLVQAATLCGLAQRLLEVSISHTRDRVQFGQALANFQVVRHRLVDMHLQVAQAKALWRQALAAAGEYSAHGAHGHEAAQAGPALHAASARAADAALSVARSAVQVHGATGYTPESPAGMGLVLAMRMAAAVGPADAHRRRAAIRASLEALAR